MRPQRLSIMMSYSPKRYPNLNQSSQDAASSATQWKFHKAITAQPARVVLHEWIIIVHGLTTVLVFTTKSISYYSLSTSSLAVLMLCFSLSGSAGFAIITNVSCSRRLQFLSWPYFQLYLVFFSQFLSWSCYGTKSAAFLSTLRQWIDWSSGELCSQYKEWKSPKDKRWWKSWIKNLHSNRGHLGRIFVK